MNVYVAKGSWTDVVAVTDKILGVDSYHYIAGWNKIRALITLGRFDDASALSGTLLKVYPSDQTLLVQQAMSLAYAKKNAEAIAAYRNVQAIYPSDPTAKAGLKALKM